MRGARHRATPVTPYRPGRNRDRLLSAGAGPGWLEYIIAAGAFSNTWRVRKCPNIGRNDCLKESGVALEGPLIEESKATAVFSGLVGPVVAAQGYRATRYQGRARQSPAVQWEKPAGDDFILRVHLQPGKSPRFHYVNLNLYARVNEKGKRAKSRKAVLLGRLEELVPPSQRLTYHQMFDCQSPYNLDERESCIAEKLRTYGLPVLESLADYETVVEAYLCGCILIEGRWFGSLQPDGWEYFQPVNGTYMPVLDLPVLGDPVTRMTDNTFRRGRVALLNAWTVDDPTCRQSHAQLLALSARKVVDIYGIADRDGPDDVSAFLSEFGNPYIACALELDGTGSRTPCGNQPIDWRRQITADWQIGALPVLRVIDGNGVERHLHFGRITKDVIEREVLPAIDDARKPYAYVPHRARKLR